MDKLKIISSIVVIGFTVSVIYHYVLAYYFGMNTYPYNSFLFDSRVRFDDFFSTYKASANLDPYSPPGGAYFPFAYIIMYFNTLFDKWIALGFFIVSYIAILWYFISKQLLTSGKWENHYYTFILIFMSYPILYVIDRGNIEIWLFLSILFFHHFYLKEKYIVSALFLSIAISFKLYPVVLGLLFILDKKYRELFYTTFFTLTLTILSMVILQGGFEKTFIGLFDCLGKFGDCYLNTLGGIQHNVSFFAPTKYLYYMVESKYLLSAHIGHLFNTFYFILSLFLFGGLTYFLFRYKFSNSKKITLLVLSFLILPQISFDYKLINIYIPLVLFLKSVEKSKFENIYAILFGLLLIPKDYFYFVSDVSIAIVITPLLILSLIVLFIFEEVQRPLLIRTK
jgi:hypothetical protein